MVFGTCATRREPPAAFATAVKAAVTGGAVVTPPVGESIDAMLARLNPMFFDPAVDPIVTAKTPPPGKDILTASANNLYAGVTLADLKGFNEKYGLNSRLVKQDGKLVEEVYRAGGRYSKEITQIVTHLEAAIPYASEPMAAALRALPAASVVLLHGCCHNPTGVDLTSDNWLEVVNIVKERALVPFIDLAYQGFAEGPEPDAFAVRAFADAGVPTVISSSFSKSFSLYRERVGAITFVTGSADEAKRATSQLKRTIRSNYSNPSSHGAQIAAMILSDAELRKSWEAELTEMRERIVRMRALFVQKLATKQQARDFSFVQKQRGMFSYSGLELPRVQRLRSEFGIYVVDSGRICVAAMNENNIDYITESIAQVL